MLGNELKEFRLLKIIYQSFPDAEIQSLDGTRERLSDIFDLADDVKSPPAISRKSKIVNNQSSFDFVNNGRHSDRGAT